MIKINAEICRDAIGNIRSAMSYRGITLAEEIYLQSLEIAQAHLENHIPAAGKMTVPKGWR